jgi:hypothetical protein
VEIANRKKILEWMQRHDVTRNENVSEFISLYYRDPKTLMRWVEKDIPPAVAKTKAKKLFGFVTDLKAID